MLTQGNWRNGFINSLNLQEFSVSLHEVNENVEIRANGKGINKGLDPLHSVWGWG